MFTPEQFSTSSLRDPRVLRILAAAFNAADPYTAVKKYIDENPIPKNKKVFAFGLGKAAIKMTQALADSIPLTDTLVITKHASLLTVEPATVILGNHPIPGMDSLAAGRAALEFVSKLTPDDLLICLISGGGSALMTAPVIPLDELQSLTSALLASGARIDEINTIRRHLDSLKGGGLAQAANGAQIISLILSDVVGDPVEAIASGPTAPDSTTNQDTEMILDHYNIPFKRLNFKETLKPSDPVFTRVKNQIVISNLIALQAAKEQAEREGFVVKIVNEKLQGEAREVGKEMALLLKEEVKKQARPFCLLAGGETTVTLKGNGKGGRNQEVVLGAVEILKEMENVLLISVATDGEDGPTNAAGAAVTSESARKAGSLGLSVADSLSRNDAYAFFDQLGDLIKTGPSGTNVNDILICTAK
ncbi:MAG: glycerate kinase [Anaerolineales bacterium]|nr:glycerate kinase [Anaerolineales bacterium]